MKNHFRRIILVALLIQTFTIVQARQYFVHYVKGNVSVVHSGVETPLREKSYVSDNDRLIVGQNCGVILINSSQVKIPMIKGPANNKVKKILKQESTSFLEFSNEFVRFLFGKSFSEARNAKSPDGMSATGGITRSYSTKQSKKGKKDAATSKTLLSKDECLDEMERYFQE